MPSTGKPRFIEAIGRAAGAPTVSVTKNEILTGLNKPDDLILAIVLVEGLSVTAAYVRQPFQREPDFGVNSVSYDVSELLAGAVTRLWTARHVFELTSLEFSTHRQK